MSAHRIYCYDKQRAAVEAYLRDLGVVLTSDVPHIVHTADQLLDLDHITFITVDNHASPVPQDMWDAVVMDGALVIHVDDQYTNHASRVHVRHYEPAAKPFRDGDYLPEGMSVEQYNKDFSPCGS